MCTFKREEGSQTHRHSMSEGRRQDEKKTFLFWKIARCINYYRDAQGFFLAHVFPYLQYGIDHLLIGAPETPTLFK